MVSSNAGYAVMCLYTELHEIDLVAKSQCNESNDQMWDFQS